jgi:hypothetical protein
MDKAEFIEVAPQYYSLAIIVYLYQHGGMAVSHSRLISHYYDTDEQWSYFAINKLFELAVGWLNQRGIIDLITDPFGSPIISASSDFSDRWSELGEDKNFPLFKYHMTDENWLQGALRSLDVEYRRLGIVDEDFDEPDKDWEPLPLEREDPQLQKAIDAVDDTAEKVRADNGYAAHLPEEREYVLDNLSALSKRLKEAQTVSLAYLREFAFAPLSKLLRRFKDAAIGLAASVAKEALKDWLKRKGITVLDDLF